MNLHKEIYILEGGFGTMYQLYNYPEKYAAGMALCGWTKYNDLTPLANMSLWIAIAMTTRL